MKSGGLDIGIGGGYWEGANHHELPVRSPEESEVLS